MKWSRMFFVLAMILTSGFSFAQTGTGSLIIEATGNGPVVFCKDSVVFGPMVSVVGDSIYDGLKVSIANYLANAERLDCPKHSPSLTTSWNGSTGTLEIRGKATADEYRQAIENTRYINLKAVPDTATRQIAVNLIDADFLPATGHFYRYYAQTDITWTAARDSAAAKTYRGLQGYMATITSKVENDFIWTKINGVGWIGAADYETEGVWKWMTGPEKGTIFWRGTYNGGYAVNGAYSFWGNYEPNNAHGETNGGIGEDYAHITQDQDPGQPQKSWNDLRINGDGTSSLYYRPRGYVVEFGGMAGDPVLRVSASFGIRIRKIQFGSKADRTICRYDSVQLNHDFGGQYSWTPLTGLNADGQPNPWVSPADTTRYWVTANFDGCIDTASFRVNVKPVPVFDLGADQDWCTGQSTTLNALPQNGASTSTYKWNTGATTAQLSVQTTGVYSVLVTNAYSCSADDTVQVSIHNYPVITVPDRSVLSCDTRSVQLAPTADKGTADWTTAGNLTFSTPDQFGTVATAADTGRYVARVRVTDQWGCQSRDSVVLRFYDTPSTQISIDSLECSGYSLGVKYEGTGSRDARYSWYFPDALYAEGVGLQDLNIELGFGQTNQRRLGLKVDESGCATAVDWTPVHVTPNVDLTADRTEGCMPLSVTLTAQSTETIDSYTWAFGDGIELTTRDPFVSYTYDYAGTYDVTLQVISAEGCSNSGTRSDWISVYPKKTAYTDIDPNRCYPDEISVVYQGSGSAADTYHWDLSELAADEIIADPGTAMGPLTISLKHKPSASIGLQVVSDRGCAGEVKRYSFKRKPLFGVQALPASGCAPLTVNLLAESSDAVDRLSYTWNTGLQQGLTGAQLEQQYTEQGKTYPVSATAVSAVTGCSENEQLAGGVTVHSDPVAEFTTDRWERLISEADFRFTNQTTGADRFDWDFGDGNWSQELHPANSYRQVGWFTVHLQAVSAFGCIDTVSHRVLVAPEDLFPPNAINPNSTNPENRVFRLSTDAVQDEGYKMQIFNRWGEVVFESDNRTVGWDATMKNGKAAPAGTYVWVLSYRDVLGKSRRQSGTVMVVF